MPHDEIIDFLPVCLVDFVGNHSVLLRKSEFVKHSREALCWEAPDSLRLANHR